MGFGESSQKGIVLYQIDDGEDAQGQILSNGFGARDLDLFHASSKDH